MAELSETDRARIWRGLLVIAICVALSFAITQEVNAGMQRFYLLPIETDPTMGRGPMYFCWGMGEPVTTPCITGWNMMDYGFTPYALLKARDISEEDRSWLLSHDDVFEFPENLDGPVDDPAVDVFFEAIHLPTDWLTPSTTWRELLRQVAGMFQFNQRYGGISGVNASIFDNATLDTRLREMTDQEQAWFLATVESFGYDSNLVPTNARLRQLVKSAGDYWAARPFYLGGTEF